jgi:hypothetical protein
LVVLVWYGGIVIVVCCDCIDCVYGSHLLLYCLSWLLYLSEKRDTETPREYVPSPKSKMRQLTEASANLAGGGFLNAKTLTLPN